MSRDLLHDMLAELPAGQAADPDEFLARLGQFSLINPAERAGVLAARTRAGLVLVAIAVAGALGALALPAVRNTTLTRG